MQCRDKFRPRERSYFCGLGLGYPAQLEPFDGRRQAQLSTKLVGRAAQAGKGFIRDIECDLPALILVGMCPEKSTSASAI